MRKAPIDSRGRALQPKEYERDGYYVYKYQDTDGKWKQKTSKWLMKSDVPRELKGKKKSLREIEKDVQRDLNAGLNVADASRITLNDQWEHYMSTKKGLRGKTVTLYRDNWERRVRNGLGMRKIDTIRYSDILNLYTHMRYDEKLSYGAIELINKTLVPALRMAVKDDLIPKNPAEGVLSELKRSDPEEPAKRIALTEKQETNLLVFLKNSKRYGRYYNLVYTMLVTGMRVGEVCALRWEDISFDKMEIHVRLNMRYDREIGESSTSYKIGDPKTKKSVRTIPMFPRDGLPEVLMDEYKYQEECERQGRYGFNRNVIMGYSGFVFRRDRDGQMLNCNVINSALDRLVNAYNREEESKAVEERREPEFIPIISCHNLRHTFLVRLCERTSDIPAIMDIMGHTNFNMTNQVYNEVQSDHRRRHAEGVESVIPMMLRM